jgi:hypothetical protein
MLKSTEEKNFMSLIIQLNKLLLKKKEIDDSQIINSRIIGPLNKIFPLIF